MKHTHFLLILLVIACNTQPTQEAEEDSELPLESLPWTTPADSLATNATSSRTTLEDTVLTFGKWQVHLRKTDSVEIPPYFENQALVDSLSKAYSNAYQAAKAWQAVLLSAYPNRVRVLDPTLELRLQDGSWYRLMLDEEMDEVGATFCQYFPKEELYLLRTQWGEGNGYRAISARDGSSLPLYGRLYFSPDRSLAIAANADPEAHYSHNGFQLFEVKQGTLELVGAYEFDAWGPDQLVWIGPKSWVFQMLSPGMETGYLKGTVIPK